MCLYNVLRLGHSNLMFYFTSTPTQDFANLIYKCKLVGMVKLPTLLPHKTVTVCSYIALAMDFFLLYVTCSLWYIK